VIVTRPQPACVINSASAYVQADTDILNNVSSVALRRPDIERCVDLAVEVVDWYQLSFPCDSEGEGGMNYQLKISNSGLDEARNVVLEVSETLYKRRDSSSVHPTVTACVVTGRRWRPAQSNS